MKICAVICEYNPFHNGHKYLLEQAKRLSGCDAVLCVMSGNFVQRAEPAIIEKRWRTLFALQNGADFVVELPIYFSTACAEIFAKGAISIINALKSVTHIAFGCEDNNIALLDTIACIQNSESPEFKANMNKMLTKGMPFSKSYADSTALECQKLGFDISMCDRVLSKPNNLLAIEYLKQIKIQGLELTAVPILRLGSDYNDLSVEKNLSSAAAIRQALCQKDFDSVKNNVPQNTLDILKTQFSNHSPDAKIFEAFVIDAVRKNDLSELLDSGEGLEIKLKKEALKSSSLDEILNATKSKRYTMAKIKRLCLQALFGITKKAEENNFPPPIKLLGLNNKFKGYLKNLPKNSIIQIKDYQNLDNKYLPYFLLEARAAEVYSLLCRYPDYAKPCGKLITVD